MNTKVHCNALEPWGLKHGFRQVAAKDLPFMPIRGAAGRPSSRSRKGVVVQARRQAGRKARDEELEEETASNTGLLGGLFGNRTGTRKLTAGKAEDNEPAPRSTPSKKSAPRNFLQTARISRKDQNLVFVAGATGRLGLRIVRELLQAGFKVRAGARNTQKAQNYVDVAASLGLLTQDAVKRLQIVPVDLEDPGSIAAALGGATRVVQAIGAAENNVLDFGAPKRIDNKAAVALVDAAVETGVTQYVMVTSLGTGKFGWPASALNLFGGILTQKRQAEKALESSGLNYTIVRPGGMERPTDDYKKTNNVRLSTADKLFGGQVSRLQVAELITSAVANPELAENKVLEVVAEKTAPKVTYEELLRTFGTSEFVAEPESQEEEQPPQEAPVRASRAPKRSAPRRPPVKQRQPQALTGNQDAIAEDLAKKEIDMKLKRDAPEPSQQSQNVAEDIAKAEINIDQGKEQSTKGWFGLGGRSKGKASSLPEEESKPSTSGTSDPVGAPIQAAQDAVKSVGKPTQSAEDLERFRSARNKSAEDRAKREAEFLARMQTERQEEEKKKKAAREKASQDSLDKARQQRDALLAKQEEQQKMFQEKEAKRTAGIAERVAKSKSQTQTEAATPQPTEATTDLAKQAKQNAEEARKWIEEWRAGQSSGKSSGNGASPAASSNGAAPSEASSNGTGTSSNASEARKWIQDWRSRTGAAK